MSSSHKADDAKQLLKDELELLVRRLQAELEAHLENPSDKAALKALEGSIERIRQAFTRLDKVEAATLAQEMAGLVHGLAGGQIAWNLGSDALLQAVLKITQYLEWLQRDSWQQGFDLLPLINHIRSIRGSNPLDKAELNFPAYGAKPTAPATATDLPELATQVRPLLQNALLSLLRDKEQAENLEQIITLFSQLKEATSEERSYRFLWLAESLLLEVSKGGIPLDQNINLLLRDIDVRIKHLIETGDLFDDADAARAFSQRFIDQLTNCEGGLVRLKERTNYNPPHTDLTAASRSMLKAAGLPDVETLLQIADLLKEALAIVKDRVSGMVSEGTADGGDVEEQRFSLHGIANVLMLLNMDAPAALLDRQGEVLQQWSTETDPNSKAERIAQFADSLVLVEDSLNGVNEFAYGQQLATPASGDGIKAVLERHQYQWNLKLIVRELVNQLRRARELAGTSLDSSDEMEAWRLALAGLHEVHALLQLLGHERAVVLLSRLQRVVRALASEKVEEKSLVMDAFSEFVATLEYYLRLTDGGAQPDEGILDYAERQITLLEGLSAIPLDITIAEENELAGQLEAFITSAAPQSQQLMEPTNTTTTTSLQEAPPPAPSAAVPKVDDIDPEFLEVFLEEAQGELESIREQLPAWRENLQDQEALSTIRRSFHTLKGSGRMVGLVAIGEFAWQYEQLLNRILDSTLAPSSVIVEAVDAAQAALIPLVNGTANPSERTASLDALTQRAEALLRGDPVELLHALEQHPPAESAPLTTADLTSPVSSTPEPLATAEPVPADASDAVTGTDPELVEIFLYEAAEILDASDTILERWRLEQDNNDLLTDFRREMHTLKGSSRMTGFMAIGDLAHSIESVLNVLSSDVEPKSRAAMTNVIQQSLDRLNNMVAAARQGAQPAAADDLITELKQLVGAMPITGKPLAMFEETTEEEERTAQDTVEMEQELNAVPEPGEAVANADTSKAVRGELTELDQELVAAFQYEAAELLDSSEVTLQRWGANLSDLELLNDLRREMHTLKGSSRMTGFMVIGDLAHAMESLLDAIGKRNLQPTPDIVNALQLALDKLHDMLGRVRSGAELFPADELLAELRGLLGEKPREAAKPVAAAPTPQLQSIEKLETPTSEDTIRVSAALLNDLVNEMGESSIYRARVDQGVSTLRFNLSELEQTVHRLRQQLRRLEIETEAQILFRYEEGKGSQEDFDPLELDRFSELQQLSRSLIEIVDDLANIQTALDDQTQEMGFLLDQQAKVNKEVQQGLMRTRMVRFNSAAPRLRRVVRQVAQELGKKAELVFEGSEAEIDRAVLDNMVAPLEHMLRNSISHGIEEPQQRVAKGKSEIGNIVLSIRREGAELVLDLQDDGAGLDYERIRAKGEAQGLLKPGQPASEDELIALLLRPGFSTATQVTQISGRGVGMDVLNNAIKEMRGALLIQSQPGQGTNFMIRLPFSLAITQALLIRAGDDIYAIPLLSINSVARLGEAQYKDYLEGRPAEYEHRGHDYPVHSLGILFGVESAATSFDKAEDKRPPVLMFRSAEASAALQVDAVLGNQEVIVKPVGPQFQTLNGISGATVLGDGRVVVVLELAALVRNLASQSHKQEEARALSMARQEATRRELIKVLVIDDSITMRKVTARFLERHNLSVATAKDGVDALAKLEEQVPDLVILDIEMPRMDGFEVAAHIRNQAHLHHIPIIMVTSRGGEKHRARAAKLGVNDYLTKPYQEEQMIQSIRRILDKQGSDWSVSDLAIS
ncbi:MAG: Hpt domain-containing protein [Candidatus Competibacteraceae bacterium]|jgi:chemosensory pili system protein ChpA (sensor histidine kinase/response regulator)|nr:Hpt domain-containing protein [Candidatus Competibacteraceae bacterium]